MLVAVLFLLVKFAYSRSNVFAIYDTTDFDAVMSDTKDKYNRDLMPQMEQNNTIHVQVGFYVETLSGIRPETMDFDLDIYFRESWIDERLKHNQSAHVVITDVSKMNKIWRPNIYFANSKKADFQEVTKPNFFLAIYNNGTLHLSQRIRMVVSCNMNLRKYPFDEQHCELRIQPYTIPLPQLNLTWFDVFAIAINKNNTLPELEIAEFAATYCNGSWEIYGQTQYGFQNVEFSCLLAKLHLKRLLGYHLTQTYIPTILIVMISWVGFWIDPLAVPARISLSFTTLLTLATANTGVRMSLPPVSYAKAIDYWMGACMAFVFVALVEYTIVNMLIRKAKNFELQLSVQARGNKDIGELMDDEGQSAGDYREIMVEIEKHLKRRTTVSKLNSFLPSTRGAELMSKINYYHNQAIVYDKICRILFPLLFLLFNTVYWCNYIL